MQDTKRLYRPSSEDAGVCLNANTKYAKECALSPLKVASLASSSSEGKTEPVLRPVGRFYQFTPPFLDAPECARVADGERIGRPPKTETGWSPFLTVIVPIDTYKYDASQINYT